MPSMRDPEVRARMLSRLGSLTDATRARWGRMSAAQMAAHLDAQMRDVLGEIVVAPRPVQMRNPLMQWLIIEVMPWPKGKLPTAPEYVVATPGELASVVAGLRERVERWSSLPDHAAGTVHPFFGPLPAAKLGKLLWKHWTHHLTQFGV